MLVRKGNAMADDALEGKGSDTRDRLDLTRLIPDLLTRYFDFFREAHQGGLVPSRVKELARLKVAAINQCDT
jgi:hypothetical protein